MARDVTISLQQTAASGKRRRVELLDNRELHVEEQSKRSKIDYSVDLLALEEHCRRKLFFSWPWLLCGVVIFLVVLILWWLTPQFFSNNTVWLKIMLLAAGGVVIGICVYKCWMNSSRRLYFVSRHAKIPLLELEVDKPSGKTFKEFVSYMENRIKALQEHFQLSMQQQLSGEMRMLRRLVDKKILSEADYESAKANLLGRFS